MYKYNFEPNISTQHKIDILELSDEKCKFSFEGDLSIANALRRVMIAEVPVIFGIKYRSWPFTSLIS